MACLGIDLAGINSGGGARHILEVLKEQGVWGKHFDKVIVWCRSEALAKQLEQYAWLHVHYIPAENSSIFKRLKLAFFTMPKLIKDSGCDVLFNPSGFYLRLSKGVPFVSMSRTMLPYDYFSLKSLKSRRQSLRYFLARFLQKHTFKISDGVIFLNDYVKERVGSHYFRLPSQKMNVIAHGADSSYFNTPRPPKPLSYYTPENPMKLLYISHYVGYKMHSSLIIAFQTLLKKSYPIELHLVGARVKKLADDYELTKLPVHLHENATHQELRAYFAAADLFVFCSACENLPNTLIEAMASGLPIVCSDRMSMPTVLRDAGWYCDPTDPTSISRSIEEAILSSEERAKRSSQAYALAQGYSWEKCARETASYLASFIVNKDSVTC